MQHELSATLFYSFLFALGGAPTIAMLIIRIQTDNPDIIYSALIGLSAIIACVLVPLILIQNSILILKRKNESLLRNLKFLKYFYLSLNACCLVFWIGIQYWGYVT